MRSAAEIIETARRMLALDLVTGTFGNVSCRSERGLLITPSGLDYAVMRPEDLVLLSPRGHRIEGERAPSSEFRLHVVIYRKLHNVRAIVHTHSRCAVGFAVGADSLRTSESDVLAGPIPVAPFRPAGTQALADGAADLLVATDANAVILRNHGVVGLGRNLSEALRVCVEVEEAAAGALPSSECGYA